MNNIIKFYEKSVYGNQMMYIADKKQAESITRLTGQKSLTSGAFKALQELGFTFEEVIAPKK